jgi:hypothetical protein
MFKDLYDRVDVDEKWFFLTRDAERYIVVDPNYDSDTSDDSDSDDGDDAGKEDVPTRRTRHKGYIGKVLFLCAQARPRFDPHRNAFWDGKVGIWPIGKMVPAQRTSNNRLAGTLEWKDESVTNEVYRKLLLEKVVPAIQQKWPRGAWNNPRMVIRIQQDGPKAHIKPDDVEWNEKLQQMGLEDKLLLYTQPANSPDLNILDLGFFASLQSAYLQFCPQTPGDIIKYVLQAHTEYPRERINRMYLTLMSCMNMIIDHGGDNDYKIPHMGKEQLERQGLLPITLPVTKAASDYLEDE